MRSAKSVPFGWIAGAVAVNEAGAEGISSLTGSLVVVAAGTAATPSEGISFLRSAPSLTANKVDHLSLFLVSFLWQNFIVAQRQWRTPNSHRRRPRRRQIKKHGRTPGVVLV